MPALSFHQDPRERLRKAVHDALDGCSFESAATEDEGMFVVKARRVWRDPRLRYRATTDEREEIVADGLDFGEFGHRARIKETGARSKRLSAHVNAAEIDVARGTEALRATDHRDRQGEDNAERTQDEGPNGLAALCRPALRKALVLS